LNAREREFELPALKLAAREWGQPGGAPIIALHGWLDNAGSFDALAPLLDGCHLIALDSAGHGLSSNRSPDSGYNIWQDVGDVLDVADALGWSRFNLLGHSRGAAIVALFAGTFPERVERVAVLEGGVPIVGKAEDAPAGLAEALRQMRALRGKSGRVFAERAVAIEERAKGFTPVTVATAEVLAQRALREVEGGFQWHADQRLKAGSELKLTWELAVAFIERIRAPVLAVLAERSPFADRAQFKELLTHVARLEQHRLPGGHHFHMEGAETGIAALLRPFFGLSGKR
jgi:pimeloyl-ACP methyl ester carboxylesterase